MCCFYKFHLGLNANLKLPKYKEIYFAILCWFYHLPNAEIVLWSWTLRTNALKWLLKTELSFCLPSLNFKTYHFTFQIIRMKFPLTRTQITIFLLILVIFPSEKAFGIQTSYTDTYNYSKSLTLKMHFKMAASAVFKIVWIM